MGIDELGPKVVLLHYINRCTIFLGTVLRHIIFHLNGVSIALSRSISLLCVTTKVLERII